MTSERHPSAYQRITGADWRHIFVVGDVHGCYRQLMTMLEQVGFDTGRDLLVSVGDLIDRGSQSLACLDLLQQRWFRAVRGNHEQMALDALNDTARIPLWRANGGDWFFQLDDERQTLARRLLALAAQLPYVIEIATADRVARWWRMRITRRIAISLTSRCPGYRCYGTGSGSVRRWPASVGRLAAQIVSCSGIRRYGKC
ncbi:metallophosphoesterase [Dickeya sp. NCPPB 3274]|uniref:metallophosphoesterase n=1 Tax=Dickeya sp. NCPPB 3274 TaxID=568766 RepID=UPI000B09B3DA